MTDAPFTPPMTEDELATFGRALIAAVDNHDGEAMQAAFDMVPRTAAATGLVLLLIPRVAAQIVRLNLPADADPDLFAAMKAPDDAPDAVLFAGRLLTTSLNGDRETATSIVDVILHRHAANPEGDLLSDTMQHLLTGLHAAMHDGPMIQAADGDSIEGLIRDYIDGTN